MHLGNSMGKPAGIKPATHTLPVEQPYPQPYGFTRQNKPENVENGPELVNLWLISMNFTKSAITPSVLAQNLCSWTRFEVHG